VLYTGAARTFFSQSFALFRRYFAGPWRPRPTSMREPCLLLVEAAVGQAWMRRLSPGQGFRADHGLDELVSWSFPGEKA
jgi:hypothetical protein